MQVPDSQFATPPAKRARVAESDAGFEEPLIQSCLQRARVS